ncbi:MAG: ABC transporter permease subunit, partial [Actinobacteria bacterium]|nr:ABC transporter permease subunit [Actinomycetota bacterium]
LVSFFKTIPNELMESATIDGCSSIKVLFKIIVPLSKPAIVTLIITNALWVWNELIIALVFMHTDKMRTVMGGLTVFQSKYSTNITTTFAGLFIGSLPLIILYISFQRYFIRGIISGALKG